jgi:hypothetical protein
MSKKETKELNVTEASAEETDREAVPETTAKIDTIAVKPSETVPEDASGMFSVDDEAENAEEENGSFAEQMPKTAEWHQEELTGAAPQPDAAASADIGQPEHETAPEAEAEAAPAEEAGPSEAADEAEAPQEVPPTEKIAKLFTTGGKTLKQKRVKKKDSLGPNWFFWISLVLLLIPVAYFGWLLYKASEQTTTPIVGTRITDEITDVAGSEQLTQIKSQAFALEGVEGADVDLIVETLRIKLNVDNNYTAEQMTALNESVYQIVDSILPVDTYFTQHDGYKQYDLEIYSYTDLEAEDCIIVLTNKNSKMTEPHTQVVSSPLNPDETAALEDLIRQEEEAAQNGDTGDTAVDESGSQDSGQDSGYEGGGDATPDN